METLLIVDDNPDIRQQLKWGLSEDYTVLLAEDVTEGLAIFKKHQPKVVILDLGLPPCVDTSEEGFRCLAAMLELDQNVKIIMLTGNDERENALKATQMGAYDFFAKPPVLEDLSVIIRRAFYLSKLEEQNRLLQRSVEMAAADSCGMIGHCPEMQKVFATIRKVAPSEASIFVSGESGTGKELVARAIHDASNRKNGPFIAINCGAIPENLLESEFFGHEKGAFTGAHATVKGKLQFAHKGTLFLDEIGELPLNLQVKLLRFLQEGIIQRVGGRENIEVDTRVISATNVDINKAISEGKFREDLYYRVGIITLNLPPLRDRGDDITVLSHCFLRMFNCENNKKVKRFSPSALKFLKNHEWPGNVRELRNRIQRAVIMCEGTIVEPEDLGCEVDAAKTQDQTLKNVSLREARDMVEAEMISLALENQSGNIVKAAEELGVTRPTLYDLMKKHGLTDGIRRSEAGQ
jgi:two-component system, NtrC family, response regulator